MRSETEPSFRPQQGPGQGSMCWLGLFLQAGVSWVSSEKPTDSGFQADPLGCLVVLSYLEELLTLGTLEVPHSSSARTG